MRLQSITYSVDTSTSSDPKLVRTQSGVQSTLAEQVIGFKVGAATWNTSTSDDTSLSYSYNSSKRFQCQPCRLQQPMVANPFSAGVTDRSNYAGYRPHLYVPQRI